MSGRAVSEMRKNIPLIVPFTSSSSSFCVKSNEVAIAEYSEKIQGVLTLYSQLDSREKASMREYEGGLDVVFLLQQKASANILHTGKWRPETTLSGNDTPSRDVVALTPGTVLIMLYSLVCFQHRAFGISHHQPTYRGDLRGVGTRWMSGVGDFARRT